jgi:hypothetical protein
LVRDLLLRRLNKPLGLWFHGYNSSHYDVADGGLFVAVSAKTKGWVAVGLGSAKMDGAVIFIGSVGNLVEWYDFYTYAAFALYFAPSFFPDSRRIIFASNRNDPRGRNFDLFTIGADGTGLTQITYNPTFDGFPMFSPDGKKLVFCSNRHNAKPGETNVFVADWVP